MFREQVNIWRGYMVQRRVYLTQQISWNSDVAIAGITAAYYASSGRRTLQSDTSYTQ